MIDVHAHLVALPTPDNGCLMSRRMLRRPLARFLAWRMGIPLENPAEANRIYLDCLDRELSESRLVEKAVILAMDGVYDRAGKLNESRTDFLISNDAVLKAAARYPRLLPGVSINPQRRDAIDELERCIGLGARLVKVLPNTQAFDPADKRYAAFYKGLARLKIPLLTHVGYEFSLVGQDQSMGDLVRWRQALDTGVIVIAAHGCGAGLFFYKKHFPAMLEFVHKYENFFIDTAALSLPNRVGALLRLRRHPEVFDRLLFGTDYPLPCFAYPSLLGASFEGYLQARATRNRFDRHATVLRALGLPIRRDLEERLLGRQVL